MKNAAKKIYIALIFLFLYAPIGTLMVLSFNASRTRAKWGGFTFKWYAELFQNDDILRALGNTLRFGLGTILLSHITFNIPYVILSVMPRMKQLNPSIYEAALDLGAPPVTAFFKVVFPDLMPGILSGFLMAFTMSLDDFIITHFTKGAGVDTLSTKIYTEVRKGIKPEMYALSTIIFVTVLVLLILVNLSPDKGTEKAGRK